MCCFLLQMRNRSAPRIHSSPGATSVRVSSTSSSITSIRCPGEETSYAYLTDMLMERHREVEDQAPRGWQKRRLEHGSGARHMMMAMMVGVTFAVVLGMASLEMTSYQSWIAYQAWQHHVAPPVTPARAEPPSDSPEASGELRRRGRSS